MPPDIFTKMFADKDKWVKARQLINIVMPEELKKVMEDTKVIYKDILEKPALPATTQGQGESFPEPSGQDPAAWVGAYRWSKLAKSRSAAAAFSSGGTRPLQFQLPSPAGGVRFRRKSRKTMPSALRVWLPRPRGSPRPTCRRTFLRTPSRPRLSTLLNSC